MVAQWIAPRNISRGRWRWRWRVRTRVRTRNRNRTPPSTGDPWRPARRIRMVTVELPQKSGVHDEFPGNPTALLRSIALPVHEVLESAATASHSEKPPHSPLRMPINHLRWWRSRRRRHQRARGDRFYLGDVENRMDPLHGGGESETYGNRIDNVLNRERSKEPRRQLPGFHLQRKVRGGEIHLLTHFVLRGLGAPTVGSTASTGAGSLQSCTDGLPHPATSSKMDLNRRDRNLSFLVWKQGRLVSQGALKG